MKQTWRWFGPHDPVSLNDIHQAGVEGVVTALHHVPNGTVWSADEIERRKHEISVLADGSPSGFKWDVVESLPVSEDIKRQSGDWREHIANYKISLKNLSEAGIEVVCYNFMPVLDWTRTDLAHALPGGGTCMRFDVVDFAAFDLCILGRPDAEDAFPDHLVELAKHRFADMTEEKRKSLVANTIAGLPGSEEGYSLDDLRDQLALYSAVSDQSLRSNLYAFLEEVAPFAQELGMRLCCHPDDPPFPLLGLPRIISTERDYQSMIDAVDVPANGVTLCSGSLGIRAGNDLPMMMRRLGDRVHFVHLRNVTTENDELMTSFFEDEHLEGGTDMVALVSAILVEEDRRRAKGRADCEIPFRPDHGHAILSDLNGKSQPGYPAVGRLKGLAELRGVIRALEHASVSMAR